MAKKKDLNLSEKDEEKNLVQVGDHMVDTNTGEVVLGKQDIKKIFSSLADYKSKTKNKEVEYKPQEWIPMSHAFQEVTRLPGIPEGHTIMVYGKSDVGKTTMLCELAVSAQKKGILPVLIITEKKWNWSRIESMGFDRDACLYIDGVEYIEQGIDFIADVLRDQENGKLKYDLVFLWDSIGATPSKAEFDSNEEGSGKGMMVTAKLLKEKVTRFISHKISNSRKADYPYTNTLFFVNHGYISPPALPGGQPTLIPNGGDAIIYASTLVFRMGGVKSNSSKVTATKDGHTVAFAIKSALVVEKNHITNVQASGKLLCVDGGFILDDAKEIDEYKKRTRDGWDLQFDKFWNQVSVE